jgi:hypothetical protein
MKKGLDRSGRMADTSYMAAGNTERGEKAMTEKIFAAAAAVQAAWNDRVEPCRECGHVENVTAAGFCDHCIEADLATQARFPEWR